MRPCVDLNDLMKRLSSSSSSCPVSFIFSMRSSLRFDSPLLYSPTIKPNDFVHSNGFDSSYKESARRERIALNDQAKSNTEKRINCGCASLFVRHLLLNVMKLWAHIDSSSVTELYGAKSLRISQACLRRLEDQGKKEAQ